MIRSTALALVTFIALCAMLGDAHGDVIAIYRDLSRTECDTPPFLGVSVTFFVFHYSAGGATGSRFRVPRPGCLIVTSITGPRLSTDPFPWTGDVKNGIEFSYGACLTGWTFVASVRYFDVVSLGGWPFCCEQQVLTHPGSSTGQVEAIDCGGAAAEATVFTAFITHTAGCLCSVATGIPNGSFTWGAIKELYKVR